MKGRFRFIDVNISKNIIMSEIVRSECIIPDYANVTLTVTNNIVELQYLEKYNNQNNIKKLNDDYYIIWSTGEVR